MEGAQLAIEAKNLSQAMKNGNWSDGMNRKIRKLQISQKKYDVMCKKRKKVVGRVNGEVTRCMTVERRIQIYAN